MNTHQFIFICKILLTIAKLLAHSIEPIQSALFYADKIIGLEKELEDWNE